ncbi:MAG: NAD(P)/FAD-dependent oxidoreductase [Anaerolineales bacterium]
MKMKGHHRVVIIGAGFGGLFAAKALANKAVEVLLIDRLNYHTFTPLLYQVATSALDPSQIAYPVRKIFARTPNVQCLMGDVINIDPAGKKLEIAAGGMTRQEDYDYLILATGSTPDYFGREDLRRHTFDLRTLADAVRLRNHILRCFELAAWVEDPDLLEEYLTFTVVGGGPTGLETAGALHELLNEVLKREFPDEEPLSARVILVEKAPHLLHPYPDSLRKSALTQIQELGVEVILGNGVEEIHSTGFHLENGREVPSRTVVWAAGVRGTVLPELASTARNKIPVKATLEVEGFDSIYAVGDTASLQNEQGQEYPMMIPVAQQQGVLAANNILRMIREEKLEDFQYHDRGIMATIGRKRAVAWVYNRVPLTGFSAWLAWLGLHLVSLIGFRNKLIVLISWIWNYLTYDRSVRAILD